MINKPSLPPAFNCIVYGRVRGGYGFGMGTKGDCLIVWDEEGKRKKEDGEVRRNQKRGEVRERKGRRDKQGVRLRRGCTVHCTVYSVQSTYSEQYTDIEERRRW
jgi:hypothetical protein